MATNEAIELAIADLDLQETPNFTATAKKYNISRSTLSRRYKGIQLSRDESASLYRKLLTTAQEEVILKDLNNLLERGMPLTLSILLNLVQEVVKQAISKK